MLLRATAKPIRFEAEQPLVSLNAISEGSFWQRITDEALLYFE